MNLTPAEAARLGRRAQQPARAPDELLAVFVGGKLVNTKNARLHWATESKYKRGWRDRVAMALLESGWRRDPTGPAFYGGTDGWYYAPARRKRITFLASTAKTMDTDGLQIALAPVRDALIECGVISGDAPEHGHDFSYDQQIDRANRGVLIRVALTERT